MFSLTYNSRTCTAYTLLLIVLTGLTFGNTPDLLLDADDHEYFDTASKSLQNPSRIFSPDRHPTTIGRPVIDLVFLLDYFFFEKNPTPYHIQVVAAHLFAALLLAWTSQCLGANATQAFLTGLLFLLNVTHFRGVHWIASIGYPLSLIFSLSTLICHHTWQQTPRLLLRIGTLVFLSLAIWTHPSAASVLLFLVYLSWRKNSAPLQVAIQTWPLFGITFFCVGLVYLLYPQSTQVPAVMSSMDPFRILKMLLWYLSRLLTAANWLFVDLRDDPKTWELAVGVLVLLGLFFLSRSKQHLLSAFALWTVITILPFINTDPGFRWTPAGPSRHLYFASAGSSFILARGLLELCNRVGALSRQTGQGLCLVLTLALLASSIWALKRTEAISYYASGRGYIARSDMETGILQYDRAIRRDPRLTPPDTYVRIVLALFGRNRSPQSYIETGQHLYPDLAELKLFRGIWESQHADPEIQKRAEQHIRETFEQVENQDYLNRNAATAFYNLATHYYRQDDEVKASALYVRALEFHPRYLLALLYLGKSQLNLNRFSEALKAFEGVVKLDPNHTHAIENIGFTRFQQGNLSEAQAAYEHAVQLDPQNPQTLFKLATILNAQRKIEPAIRAYQATLQVEPDFIEAHLRLAQTYERARQFQAALQAYRETLKRSPNHPDAQTGLQRLTHRGIR
ncbi:MAG: tetratricopeptide repeat protein [bacterium]|nr:tetratricopeptide repeat protein [bacterium]